MNFPLEIYYNNFIDVPYFVSSFMIPIRTFDFMKFTTVVRLYNVVLYPSKPNYKILNKVVI